MNENLSQNYRTIVNALVDADSTKTKTNRPLSNFCQLQCYQYQYYIHTARAAWAIMCWNTLLRKKKGNNRIPKRVAIFRRTWEQTGFCTNNSLLRVITYAENTWTWGSPNTLDQSIVVQSLKRHASNRNKNVIWSKIRVDLFPWVNFLEMNGNCLKIFVKPQAHTVIRRIPPSSLSSSYSTVK